MKIVYIFILSFFSFSAFSQSTFLTLLGDNIPFTESYHILETSDNGFLISGNTTQPNTLNLNFYVIKLDQDGNEIWSWTEDLDQGTYFDICIQAVELDDTYAVLSSTMDIAGGTPAAPAIIYLDKEHGTMNAIASIDAYPYATIRKFIYSDDNTFIIMGYHHVPPFPAERMNLLLSKIDLEGHVLDELLLQNGGINNSSSVPSMERCELIANNSSLFVLGGGSTPINGQNRSILYLMKTTPDFNGITWEKILIGTNSGTSMDLDEDYLYATSNVRLQERAFLFKYATSGDSIWQKSYATYMEDLATCVVEGDHLFCVGNNEDYQLVLLKLDKDGEVIWNRKFIASDSIKSYFPRDMVTSQDGGVVITGIFYPPQSGVPSGIFVLRLNADGELGEISHTNHLTLPDFKVQAYPNPVTEYLTIENQATDTGGYDVTLCDSKGTIHYQGQLRDAKTQIPMQHLASGTYIVSLRNADNQIWNKMVVKQ